MPWSPSDATRFTHKAKSAKAKRAFAHAANSVLAATGNEGRAVRAGNAAVIKTIAAAHKCRGDKCAYS